MGPAIGFWIAFVTTLALLVLALVSGHRRQRRVHLLAAPLSIVSLAVAVVLTEQLVRGYVWEGEAKERLRVHLWFAKSAGALVLPVVVTGVWLWLRPAARRWHAIAVWVFMVAALAATGTGIWAFGAVAERP